MNNDNKRPFKNEWSMRRKIHSLLEINYSLAGSKSLVHDKLETEETNLLPVGLRPSGKTN